MSLVPRWVSRMVSKPDRVDTEREVHADVTAALVSAQVAELRSALRRIERREAARRGRPETA